MSHDAKEVLDFIDFSHATTAVGYVQEDGGERSKLADLEAELAAIHGIALAECDPDSREEDAALPALEVVRHLAERAAQLCETNDVFHRTGLEAMQEADRLRAALAEKEARIGELEVALARTENGLAVARGIAEAYEPALAAAHEALGSVVELPEWEEAPIKEGYEYCRLCIGQPDLGGHETDCPRLLVQSALSAPALQRAAKLDRLRRDALVAFEAWLANADFSYGAGKAWAEEADTASDALAALRAEEEKG